jgi:acetyl esterase/lipase
MTDLVTPRAPNRKTRVARRVTPVLFGVTRLIRRPRQPPAGVQESRYGQNPAERVDYIAPAPATPTRTPIVFVHGGGFIAGSKELYTRYLTPFAEAGYPVFNVEYPLAPEHPHPQVLRSLLAAIDWISEAHPDVTGFHAMGDSAGANLAAMLGILSANPALIADVDPTREGGVPLRCHSVVSMWGVLDRLSGIEDGFPNIVNCITSYGGPEALEAEVGPESAITPMDLAFESAPPSFVCVGTKDPLRRSSQLFADRLKSASLDVVHKEYAGERHGFFCFGSARSAGKLNDDILEFLESVDGGGAGKNESP